MRQTYATAIKLEHLIEETETNLTEQEKKDILFSCRNTKWIGKIYLAENAPSVSGIFKLGFKLKREGNYYVLPRSR